MKQTEEDPYFLSQEPEEKEADKEEGSPTADLSGYIKKVQKFPFLTPEEEIVLANRWIKDQDKRAAHKLITSHLRLVVKIAFGFRGYGLPMGDLIAEGNVGILQALKKFDPEKGFRFSTYAMWWIKAAMQEYVLESWSLVKIGSSSAQKKLFFNLRKIKSMLQNMGGETRSLSEIDVKKIATDLDVRESDVKHMEERLLLSDLSLNAPLGREGGTAEWQDFLESSSTSHEEQYIDEDHDKMMQALLQECLEGMPEREAYILRLRRLTDPPHTLEEVSKKLTISRERVRQIEEKAFLRLRLLMKGALEKKGISINK